MIRDPWRHRSVLMTCKTCMWCAEKKAKAEIESDPNEETPEPSVILGRCRRHAPTMSGYPVVYMNDWCGDHKLDENKA